MLKIIQILILNSRLINSLGPLPDASQESLLWQYRSYSNVALFHYTVPPEVTRATWEFASFQDREDCPNRRVEIFIQHGSYPVFPVDNASFPDTFYLKRTHLDQLFVYSAYQPKNSAMYPVYNPLPGSWFVAAYLESYNEPLGFAHKCKYSLGSIALWNRAESVELIVPNIRTQNFRTKKHLSYYKFFVPADIDRFHLTISSCVVRVRQRPVTVGGISSDDNCMDFVAVRGKALPLHDPRVWSGDDMQSMSNITSGNNFTFVEKRPLQSAYYYVLVVTQGQVTFDISLDFFGCGMSGLYGPGQNDWYLDERGLMHSGQTGGNVSRPKEPTSGFQLFASRSVTDPPGSPKNFDLISDLDNNDLDAIPTNGVKNRLDPATCVSTFDLTRMENVTPFSVSYLFQGKSWYTKWLTVLERVPVLARFHIQDFIDLGGNLVLKVTLDTSEEEEDLEPSEAYQEVYICISKERQPKMVEDTKMSCDNRDSVLVLSNQTTEATKVIPFPEPGMWYVGFQVRCSMNKSYVPCEAKQKSAMVAVEIRLQPCGYRALHEVCGDHGFCSSGAKGAFRFTACSCFGGYRGWTCDDDALVDEVSYLSKTLFLILSNFAFLPAIILALYYRLFTEALVYSATMFFSVFYHTCDQEASSHSLPIVLQSFCRSFYTNNEVLQFCDFYCAILSFWITIVSLARLPHRVVNFLNIFGVLLIAFLVQYNRTGAEVMFIPILLGIFVILTSLGFKSYERKRLYLPNKSCVVLLTPAATCAIVAASLTAFVETTDNYGYVHSVWHMLMAASLLFLVPRCGQKESSWNVHAESASSSSSSDGESLSIETSQLPSTESSNSVGSVPSLAVDNATTNEQEQSRP